MSGGKDTFSPIPNQELMDFILYRLDANDDQQEVALQRLHSRERLLYKHLAEAGTDLPHLTPRRAGLENHQQDALFAEIFKRGGFDLRGFPMNNKGPAELKRELWELLRKSGFVYCLDDSRNSKWSLGSSATEIYCDCDSVGEGGVAE